MKSVKSIVGICFAASKRKASFSSCTVAASKVDAKRWASQRDALERSITYKNGRSYICVYVYLNRNRDTDVENKVWTPREEGEGGVNWETGIDIYTLLYIK